MNSEFINNWDAQLKKGLLLLLVMNVIKKKSSYGHQIIKEIQKETGIVIAEGTLYPLLKVLRNKKIAHAKWEVNKENAPRKYYYMTGAGNLVLKEMNDHWKSLNKSALNIINPQNNTF